jgi:signal transduction histidine kinase
VNNLETLYLAVRPDLHFLVQKALRDLGQLCWLEAAGEPRQWPIAPSEGAILVLEAGLPGLDATRFAGLRKVQPALPVILLATPPDLGLAARLTHYNIAEIVVLPTSASYLRGAAARILQGRRVTREMARRNALIPLYETSRMFMLQTDLDTLLNRILETAVNETGAQRASLMLVDENRQDLTIQAAVGIDDHVVAQTRVAMGEGIAGWVAKTGEPLVVNEPADLPDFLREGLRGGSLRSAVCLPLTVKGQVIGVMNLAKTTLEDPFLPGDAEMLSVLAGQAAIAIANARLIEQMEVAYGELSRLDHLKTEFINVAAHELRTPVSVVVGYANILAETAPTHLKDMVQPIVEEARRLHRIVDDLFHLDYLKSLKQLDPQLDIQPVDAVEVARSAVREALPVAEARQLSLTLEAPEPVVVFGDPQGLLRILRHLLDNALKFTPTGGQVSVRVSAGHGEGQLQVVDTGPGIPNEESERIFAPFYQLSPSLRRVHGGMGVGLSLAQRLAQVQGGRLWLDQCPPPGATFCLALPLVEHGATF